MKRNYLNICLLALMMSTSFVSCEDEVQPAIVESDITGYLSEISDTILNASGHVFDIGIIIKEEYEDIISNSEWNIQEVFLWDAEMDGFNFKNNVMEELPSWILLNRIQEGNQAKLHIQLSKNSNTEKRGLSISIGQKGRDGNNYIGVFTIMQKGLEEKEGPFEVKVRYKGQIHSSMATLDEQEKLVYEDADFAVFMEDLSNRSGIEAIARENGIIDYYDNDDVEAVSAIRRMMDPIETSSIIEPRWRTFATRSDANPYRYMNANALAYCALFDDKGYKDTHIYQNFTSLTQFYDQERMQNIGLNDKVTSLAVAYNGNDSTICAVLTVWEDTNYNHGDNNRTKHRMNFVASYYSPTMGWRNLKQVPCLTGNDTWNDRISSISFHFGHYGSYLIPY